MPNAKFFLLLILVGVCQPVIGQQVYRSTDAEGNVTFSDQPDATGETVTIPAPNVGDSVKVPPPAPAPVPAPVIEPQPEIAVEELPEALQGELDGVKKKKKRRRPRKEPRGGR